MLGYVKIKTGVSGVIGDSRNEGQANTNGAKAPLLVHWLERLEEREDERV
jgi:hypothetical protein